MSFSPVGGANVPRYQEWTAQAPIGAPTTNQVGAPQSPGVGSPATSNFVQQTQNPFAAGQAAPAITPEAAATADRLFNEVGANTAGAQAYNNYPHDARAEASKAMTKPAADQIVAALMSNPNMTDAQYNSMVQQMMGPVDAQLDAQFGKIPANPNVTPPPPNAFDWNGYNAAAKQLTAPIAQQLAAALQANPNMSNDQYNAMVQQAMGPVDAQLAAQFPNVPQTRSPSDPQDPAAMQAYNQKLKDLTASSPLNIPQIIADLGSGKLSPEGYEKLMKDESQRIADAAGPPPPLKGPELGDDQATRDAYAQNVWQANSQIQQMQAGGSSGGQIQAFALQRQAELDQCFPKVAMRESAEKEWKAVAGKMQQNGASPDQVKEYLRKKASEYKEPSQEEMAVFVEKRAGDAAQIQQLAAQMNNTQKAKPKTDIWAGMLGQPDSSPMDENKKLVQSFQG